MKRLYGEFAAEGVGTFLLVFFGVGSVQSAVLTGSQSGLWQVAVVWGIGIALAIYAVGSISGAHMNPAVSLAMATYRDFPRRKVPMFWLAQLVGAFAGAFVLHQIFAGPLAAFELAHHIVRGHPGSEASAMVFGEYFPNPGVASSMHWTPGTITQSTAFAAETVGTALLVFFIFALTDDRNPGRPSGKAAPILIGSIVSIVISVLAPITQAGLNPARDFGPRLYSYLIGYGSVAIPGPQGGFFTVYILGPLVGGLVGGGIYQFLARKVRPTEGDL